MAKPLGMDLKSKRERKREDYGYHEAYRTRWGDNDWLAHLNNPIYAVLIDSIINSYLMQNSDYHPPTSKDIGLVANTYCDYFGSARYPGILYTGLRVVKLGKSSVMYEVGIFQEGEEAVKAVGGFTQIWADKASNKTLKDGMPERIREILRPLLKGSDQDPAVSAKL